MFELSDIFLLLPGYYVFLGGVCLIFLGSLLNSAESGFREKLQLNWLVPGIFALGFSRVIMAFDSLFPESIFFWLEPAARIFAAHFLAEFFRRGWLDNQNALPAYFLHIPLAAILIGCFLIAGGQTSIVVITIFFLIKTAACVAAIKLCSTLPTETRRASTAGFLVAIPAIFFQSFLHLATSGAATSVINFSDRFLQLFCYLDLATLVLLSALSLAARYLREKSDKTISATTFSLYSPAAIFIAIMLISMSGLRLSHSVAMQQNRHVSDHLEKSVQSLAKIVNQRFAFASTSSAIMGSAPIMAEYLANPDQQNSVKINAFLKYFTGDNPGAICYIMNKEGIVQAASDLEHLFIGKNLAFREYFKQAMVGKRGLQVDIGVLTSTLGFYSSHPIKSTFSDEVIGVCAVKRNLDDLDKTLKPYHPAMLLDASGTVFLASDRSLTGQKFPLPHTHTIAATSIRSLKNVNLPGLKIISCLYAAEMLETMNCQIVMLMPSEARFNQLWVLLVILLIVMVFVAIMSGITRNSESMRSLAIAQNRFKTLFDNAPESIFVVSLVTLRIIEANQSMLRQFQLSQSAVGMGYFDLMPLKRRNISNSWQSPSKKMFKHERDFRKQNGEIFSAEVTGAIMEFNQERALLLILHDISMHREIEARLTEAKNAAEAANTLKARFFANASHEIRTPMTAIIGLTELAATSCTDEGQKHMMELIRTSSKSMLTLLNDIFDLAQITSGKLTIHPVQFNLHLLLKDLIEIIGFQAEQKSVKATLAISNDLPEMVISDPDRIRQILMNLLTSAVKFARQGEIKLNATLQKTVQAACIVEFSVSDSRSGISEDMKRNLFGAFVFNDPYIKDEARSGSLGLSISKQLIDLMGGHIRVENLPGDGTTFKVSIPLTVKSIAAAPESIAEMSDLVLIRSGRPLNFLIADDNEINLFLASSIIEKFKGTATCVGDGVEVINALKTATFDAILLDIQMPRKDGIAALKEIRSMQGPIATTPVIAISAFASDQERNMAREAGAQCYLSKPYFPEDLLNAIKNLLKLVAEAESGNQEIAVSQPADINAEGAPLKQINRHELELRVLKKPENILQINDIYQRRSGMLVKELDDCISASSCERLRETAHSIKGLAGMLAANFAFALARDIEYLSRDGEFNKACTLVPQLKHSLREIAEDLDVLKDEIEN